MRCDEELMRLPWMGGKAQLRSRQLCSAHAALGLIWARPRLEWMRLDDTRWHLAWPWLGGGGFLTRSAAVGCMN